MAKAIYHQSGIPAVELDVEGEPFKNDDGVTVVNLSRKGQIVVREAPVYSGPELPKPGDVVLVDEPPKQARK